MGARRRKRENTNLIKQRNSLMAWKRKAVSSPKGSAPTPRAKQEITKPQTSPASEITIVGPYTPTTFSVFFYRAVTPVDPCTEPTEKKLTGFIENLSLEEAMGIECPPNIDLQIISDRYLASRKKPEP